MTIVITVPADTKTPGTANHTTDHNAISDALTTLGNSAANTAGDTFTGDVGFNGGIAQIFGSAIPGTPASVSVKHFSDSVVGTPGFKVKSGRASYPDTSTVDVTQMASTNPTTLTDISPAYSIPGGDSQLATMYVLELQIFGVWQASGAFNLGWDLDGTKTNLVPVASGLASAGNNFGGTFRLYLQITTAGSSGFYNIWSGGDITNTSVSRAGATSASLNGKNTGSINTTTSHTLAVCASFSVSNASQSITGYGSSFTRKGA